jgi:hypothetical protein
MEYFFVYFKFIASFPGNKIKGQKLFESRIKNKNPWCCVQAQSKVHWRYFEMERDIHRDSGRQRDGRIDEWVHTFA